jgi:prophage tail gpP-like protein
MNIQIQDYAALRESETAEVIVNGETFDNWESVYVQHRWRDPYPTFRFTCAEQLPLPSLWTQMQFEPGEECEILLGGQHAIGGIILVRQTAYDATNHGVMLQGVGLQWVAAHASHFSKDGNFDNKSFIEMAEIILAPFRDKVWYHTVGDVPSDKFPEAQYNAGEPIWDFFERYGRQIGIRIGSDKYNNFVFIGDHSGDVAGRLTEGKNILSCQAVISIENWFSDIWLRGQMKGSDETNGTDASEQEAHAPGKLSNYRPIIIPAEEPVTLAMLQKRAHNEAMWLAGTSITVNIVVQGWFCAETGGLWNPGELVMVESPMALITPAMVLAIQTVTFTQDRSRGTLTNLELVAPWLLNDVNDVNLDNVNAPQPPGAATISSAPAANPTPPPLKDMSAEDIAIEEQRP